MSMQPPQQPLKVYLSDISPHSQAILEFFIGSTGGKSFKLVSTPAEAEAYITDFDYPGSKEHWETEHAISAKPCIVLSMENPQNSHVEWVSKPITAKALISAAKSIAEKILEGEKTNIAEQKAPADDKTAIPPSPQKTPPPLPKIHAGQSPFRKTITKQDTPTIHSRAPTFQNSQNQQPLTTSPTLALDDGDGDTSVAIKPEAHSSTAIDSSTKSDTDIKTSTQQKQNEESKEALNAQKKATIAQAEKANQRWNLLCGEQHHKNSSTTSYPADNHTYNSENYFQGTLIAGLRLARQTRQVVQIKYEPYQFYICFDEGLVFSPLEPRSDDYAKLCQTKVKPGQVNLHILTSPESADIRDRIHSNGSFTYDLESFIWTSCLLTSQGRVPSSVDIEDKYLLKYWPNFTRIENFPFAMKIAARWQKRPYTITKIAREMDIPLPYITAFYNGAIGLSLFETDITKVQQKSDLKPKKKNGLIARLFGRLTKSESPS